MATITLDTFLDGGVARTAGEAWICNGGRLIIRTDSRWHLNAPASMAGSLGAVTVSATLGGGYEIDATAVRWLAYTGGSGTVPAIGASITQGGVSSSYLLGVWASITSAPTAAGAAMPESGFIKFREATGAFAAGAMTGITATAAGADVQGWIEVVHDQAISITIPRLGSFKTRGGWFNLGTTTGAANQSVQLPTNGSATTYVPGLWIETAVADTYEFYPSIYAAGMVAANLGTDDRSKFVLMGTTGACVIGHNGTTAIGYVPPAGRKIRVPNIFMRHCTTAARATNVLPSATATTRPDFVTTSAGAIDVENAISDWYHSYSQPYSARHVHFATFDFVLISECATAIELVDGGNGTSQSLDSRTLNITSCFAGGTITDWVADRFSAGTTDHAVEIIYSIGQILTRVRAGIITFARSTGMSFQITQSTGIILNDCKSLNSGVQFTTSFGCEVNDLDHCDRYVGATTTTGIYALYVLASCKNIIIDGVTVGLGGMIANVHPYLGIITIGQSQDVTVRNIGTRSAFLSGGSVNNPAYIFLSAGNNQRVRFQRVYMSPTRTGSISTLNSDKGMEYESVYGDVADTMVVAGLNSHPKGCGGTNTTTGQASVYGQHFWDIFVSDTVGRLVLSLNEPTEETEAYVTLVSGTPKFTSAGNLILTTVGDEVIAEMDYFAKGHTALASVAPVITGINVTYSSGARWGNHDIYFQVDIGSGYGGTWLDLTAANLDDYTVDPAVGFKIKFRMVCAIANTGNLLTYIRIQTASTLAAQVGNLYPLDTTTLTLTGLVSGSDVVILAAGTTTILASVDSYASTSWGYTYETPQSVDIGIIKPGYVPLYIRGYPLGSSNASLPVAQTADRSYA